MPHYDVNLTLYNEVTGEQEPVRTIDVMNAMTQSGLDLYLGDSDAQRKALENWIEERGNEQHTRPGQERVSLKLVSWDFS